MKKPLVIDLPFKSTLEPTSERKIWICDMKSPKSKHLDFRR